MIATSRYWTMRMLAGNFDPSHCTGGYTDRLIERVQEHFQTFFPQLSQLTNLSRDQDQEVQKRLISWFKDSGRDLRERTIAGLSLRCYLSYSVFRACQNLAQRFGAKHDFTYFDILPIVLTDDGKTHIILSKEGVNQIVIEANDQELESSFRWFSVDILKQFDPVQRPLDYWAYLMTRQNPSLKEELRIQYNCRLETDWSLLNKLPISKLQHLANRDRALIKVFHAVYRRDRKGKKGKCPDPTPEQLDEMLSLLAKQDIILDSREILLQELRRIAEFCRNEQIQLANDVPVSSPPPEDEALKELLNSRLEQALDQSINEVLPKRLTKLQTSYYYSDDAPQFYQALSLIYCHRRTQQEVGQDLGLGNQYRVSRFLKLDQLINQVRSRAINLLLERVLEEANLDSTQICSHADEFHRLVKQLEAFADEIVFIQAATEYRGRNREMTSLFAQVMCSVLEEYI